MTVDAMKGVSAVALACCLALLAGGAEAHPRQHRHHFTPAGPDQSANDSGTIDAAPSEPGSSEAAWEQSGTASWYGPGFTGRRTAMGTLFDPTEMVAAHTTLPLGTRLLVTETRSGRSIVVTVTDRLPSHRKRIIDLSRGAARALGFAGRGLARVTLRELAPGEDPVEVAEAPDDAAPIDNPGLTGHAHALRTARHGQLHRRHGRP